MGLRGHRKKRQDRQAALVARRELDSGQGSYQPDRSRCVERAWSYYADEECTVEVQTHIWHENGRLVDFAIVFLALSPTGPTELERIDCRHGSTHLIYWVGTENGRAVAFASGMGFRPTDFRRPMRIRSKDDGEEEIAMILSLHQDAGSLMRP